MKTRAVMEREAARHPDAVERFREGLESCFRQWTALELAIHHQWGGPGGTAQAGELVDEVMALFLGPEIIYKDDVSLVLDDFMETYFNTILEDGSSDELGEILCSMWRQCSAGDFSSAQEIKRKESLRPSVLQQSRGLQSGGDILEEGDEDGDEDDDGLGVNGGGDGVSASVFNQAVAEELRRQREEEGKEIGDSGAMETVDADGFTLVRTGAGKKKKRAS